MQTLGHVLRNALEDVNSPEGTPQHNGPLKWAKIENEKVTFEFEHLSHNFTTAGSSSSSVPPVAKPKGVKTGRFPSNPIDASFARTPFHYISTARQMAQLGNHLSMVREFAFDMEHALTQYPKGQSCLLQISTRREDFIVDVLCPEVSQGTSDPHWLKRDFGIETAHFVDSLVLSGGLSLDRIICLACGVRLFKSKKFISSADWTVRPLSKQMIRYARLDTHFLLSAYDFFLTEFENVSEADKVHKALLTRKFVQMTYLMSDDAARIFRELFLPLWRQLKLDNISDTDTQIVKDV
uniref:3'-5' exonuclease domain-containing protein n=1 Tax=Globodera rostochiensis TaxID=31243 RepID=A0A914GWZ5_GLORO